MEMMPSEPAEDLPMGMTPITPEVGKTTANPVGMYLTVAGIVALIGSGIYSPIGVLRRKIGRWGCCLDAL